jgi:hypothetical protein
MKPRVLLLIALVLLYLIPSLVLQAVYGPSYGFLSGDDRWEPDGSGGWVMRGSPTDPMPDEPSEYIPILLLYLPIFLPAFVLILFLFTPLSRKLESPVKDQEPPPDNDASSDIDK